MRKESREPSTLELLVGGPDDPDGSRASTVLAAYFEMTRAQAVRQTVWRHIAWVGLLGSAVAFTTSFLPPAGLVSGFAALAAIALAPACVEWRAGRRLSEVSSVSKMPGVPRVRRPMETR